MIEVKPNKFSRSNARKDKSATKALPFYKRENLGNEDNERENVRLRKKETGTGWKLCKYISLLPKGQEWVLGGNIDGKVMYLGSD